MKNIILLVGLLLTLFSHSQTVSVVPPQEVPTQNLVKFNRFLFNPAFSRVGLKNSYISLYTRNQWVEFEDAPTIYMINYASRVNNNTGVGLGIQQQSNGILNYFGINANYSYGIQFSKKTWLTVGMNFNYFESGLKSTVSSALNDPLIANFEDSKLLNIKPGVNLTIDRFDIGFYAENLIGYDIRNNKQINDFNLYSAHLMYTQPLGKLKNNFARALFRLRNNEMDNATLSGNLLLDFDRLGWAQVGYNDFYGGSIGIGANITPNISIGYVLEKGLSDATNNLGITHELTLVYQFKDVSDKVAVIDSEIENESVLPEEEEVIVVNDTKKERQSEDETLLKSTDLEDEVFVNKQLINELMWRQDSLGNLLNSQNIGIIALSKSRAQINTPSVPSTQYKDKKNSYKSVNDLVSRPEETEPRNNKGENNAAGDPTERPIASLTYKKRSKPKMAIKQLDAYKPGFYLIGNVYKTIGYASSYQNSLSKKGFVNAKVIENEKNALKYVSVQNHETLENAQTAFYNSVQGRFKGDMWILKIENSAATLVNLQKEPVEEEVTKTTAMLTPINRDKEEVFVLTDQRSDDTLKEPLKDTYQKGAESQNSDGDPDIALESEGFSQSKSKELVVEVKKEIEKKDAAVLENPYVLPVVPEVESEASVEEITKKENQNTSRTVKINDVNTIVPETDHKSTLVSVKKTKKRSIHPAVEDKDIKAVLRVGKDSNLDKGYYIVANVFSNGYYLKKFIEKLEAENIKSTSFKNPKNNWNYVYLEKYESLAEAKVDYSSKMGGRYNDEIWILKVEEKI
ncbi:MAG: type IX secretion system PorP/SprF family membrane protein [Rubritalea sp.]|jgi:type IX secretion system PorP/SprF family membrane protein